MSNYVLYDLEIKLGLAPNCELQNLCKECECFFYDFHVLLLLIPYTEF